MSDKRRLRDDYKQTWVAIGVYAIRNTVEQKVFIGGARNLHGALHRHRFELTTGAHRHAALLADWQRLGADAFSFKELDQVRQRQDRVVDYDAELADLLALWTAELTDRGEQGYNLPVRMRASAHQNTALHAARMAAQRKSTS